MRPCPDPLSSIRTVTVGFGIAPNLLTPILADRALAGFESLSLSLKGFVTAGGEFHPALRTNAPAGFPPVRTKR